MYDTLSSLFGSGSSEPLRAVPGHLWAVPGPSQPGDWLCSCWSSVSFTSPAVFFLIQTASFPLLSTEFRMLCMESITLWLFLLICSILRPPYRSLPTSCQTHSWPPCSAQAQHQGFVTPLAPHWGTLNITNPFDKWIGWNALGSWYHSVHAVQMLLFSAFVYVVSIQRNKVIVGYKLQGSLVWLLGTRYTLPF